MIVYILLILKLPFLLPLLLSFLAIHPSSKHVGMEVIDLPFRLSVEFLHFCHKLVLIKRHELNHLVFHSIPWHVLGVVMF
jgi:hypothetical protein